MRVILTQHQCPGDILCMTAAVRDLRLSHPEIKVNCFTSAQELWENNPHLDARITPQNAHRTLRCEYPLINTSNWGQHHFIHGFRIFLEDALGVRIPPTVFRVDVHLSEQEKSDPYILNVVGETEPYWLVDAGYKNDFTAKAWEFARFQEVVDATAGRIRWVQIGARHDNHRRLENVIDMVGRTTHRQLLSLMYRADGVLTPVSYPMHLATMQWHGHDDSERRPCVVLGGGREPSVWEAYNCHQYIHCCGAMDCCRNGGCWKSRTVPLGDGDGKDKSLCEHPVETPSGQFVPKCMDDIGVDEVLRRIGIYLGR